MPLSTGDTLGPYSITSLLGKGGMGEVYRARDTRLNREAAVKVNAEQFGDRFKREARAVAALNHPNICTLHDVGENYLVMELVEGPTLAERIKEGAIPLEEALGIAKQIAEALEAAHDNGGAQSAPMRFGKARVEAGGGILHDANADFSTLDPDKASTILVLEENRNAGVYRLVEKLDRTRLRVEPGFTLERRVLLTPSERITTMTGKWATATSSRSMPAARTTGTHLNAPTIRGGPSSGRPRSNG